MGKSVNNIAFLLIAGSTLISCGSKERNPDKLQSPTEMLEHNSLAQRDKLLEKEQACSGAIQRSVKFFEFAATLGDDVERSYQGRIAVLEAKLDRINREGIITGADVERQIDTHNAIVSTRVESMQQNLKIKEKLLPLEDALVNYRQKLEILSAGGKNFSLNEKCKIGDSLIKESIKTANLLLKNKKVTKKVDPELEILSAASSRLSSVQ